jgi:hypothetical protein
MLATYQARFNHGFEWKLEDKLGIKIKNLGFGESFELEYELKDW